jgi:hypothetical protein
MHELFHRTALVALAAAGGLFWVSPWLAGPGLGALGAPTGLAAQWQFMLGLLGAGLVLALFLPRLRPAAIAAALVSKLAFLAISWRLAAAADPLAVAADTTSVLLLSFAAAVFARQAWQQARWDGMLALRTEA